MNDDWMRRLEGVRDDSPDKLKQPSKESISTPLKFIRNPPDIYTMELLGEPLTLVKVKDYDEYLIYLVHSDVYMTAWTVYILKTRCSLGNMIAHTAGTEQEQIMSSAPWFGDTKFFRVRECDWTINCFKEFGFQIYRKMA